MFTAWTIGVVLNARSNAARVFNQTSAAASRAQTQIGGATAAVNRQANAISRLSTIAKAGALVYAGLGMGIGAAMLDGVKGAGQLQMALTGVRNATGATTKQMEVMRQTAFDISSITGQSVVDSAKILAVMARGSGGVFSPADLAKVAIPAAKFADVQYFSRGVPFETGAQWAIVLAHMFRQYDAGGLNTMVDKMTRLSEMMPHDLGKTLTQMSYYMPVFKGLGVSDEAAIGTAALLDRFTGARRGGTWVADFALQALGPLQMTKHLQEGKGPLLRQMGILGPDMRSLFFNKQTQQYDFIGVMRQIASWAHGRDKDYVVTALRSVFGAQGGRFAMLAMDPNFEKQLNKIIAFLHRSDLSLDAQQARYMANLPVRFQQFATNFRNVFIELAWPWMTTLANTFHFLADTLHGFQQWLHEHPFAEKAIGVGATGVAITGTALGALMMGGVGFQALGFALGPVMRMFFAGGGGGAAAAAGGLTRFGIAIARFAAFAVPGGQIFLAIAAIYLLVRYFPQIRTTIEDAAHWIKRHGIPIMQDAWAQFFSSMKVSIQSWLNRIHEQAFGSPYPQYAVDKKKVVRPQDSWLGTLLQLGNLPNMSIAQRTKLFNDILGRGAGGGMKSLDQILHGVPVSAADRAKIMQNLTDPHQRNLDAQDRFDDSAVQQWLAKYGPRSMQPQPGANGVNINGSVNIVLKVDPKGDPRDHAVAIANVLKNMRGGPRLGGDAGHSPSTHSAAEHGKFGLMNLGWNP